MKTIIYTCPYVPAEWITAHGLRASRLILNSVNSAGQFIPTEGVCPFARSFISEVINNKKADGVVVTTVCDQMRRASDILFSKCEIPVFLMNVPNTWQTLAAQKLYQDELKRLSSFLIRLGGKSPSNDTLSKIMLEYDMARKSILASRAHLSARQFSEATATLGENGPVEIPADNKVSQPVIGGIPLAIIGGPLMKQDFCLLDTIEQSGGRIVLDATETGERGLCEQFDRRQLRDEPFTELAVAYFNSIQDVTRRPNSELYKWLKTKFTQREVRGIIFRRYLWCDMWHAELHRLKEWTNLPVLDIDTTGDNKADRQRTENRIRAFLEMLQ